MHYEFRLFKNVAGRKTDMSDDEWLASFQAVAEDFRRRAASDINLLLNWPRRLMLSSERNRSWTHCPTEATPMQACIGR